MIPTPDLAVVYRPVYLLQREYRVDAVCTPPTYPHPLWCTPFPIITHYDYAIELFPVSGPRLVMSVRRSVPITRPEVWEDEPYSARLRWHRAYIPQYYSTTPHSYRIEMQEAGSTVSDDWKPVASGVNKTEFTVNDVSPRKDYNFRIRAELENGDVSEPTPPIQYHRTKMPMKREPLTVGDYKPLPIEPAATGLNRPYIDHLTKYVPPRLPIDKPDMVVMGTENVELSWKPAREPEAIRGISNLTYTIEVRTPPSFEWLDLVKGLKTRNYMVDNLHPRIDYVFRVRAFNEYGPSEPSLPVSLYRPRAHDDYDDEEGWEREFEEKFGVQDDDEMPIEQVPPKLPMDTPETMSQTPESIWFQWLPARIPAYATKTPITYVVEMKEPPSTNWRRDVTGLVDTQYCREGLSPNQDYHIRVRAESEFGISEPTLPIIIQRSRGSRPGSRLSSMEREEMSLSTRGLDNLTSGVPPRMSSNRPMASNSHPEGLTISWGACRVPSYVKKSNIIYIIEKREPPGHIWTVFAKDIKDTKYKISGLNPDQDYMFRVRARNEFGTSDPSLPLTVYRERDDYVPPKIRSRSGSRDSISAILSVHRRRSMSIDYESVKSDEDYRLDAGISEKTPKQPEYIETTYDTQYGAEGQQGKIKLHVKAYPQPIVHWYRGEEKLEYGDRYNTFITPKGEIVLEIKNVGQDTVGEYKCYAENASGAAVKVVTFLIADQPTILEPLQDKLINAYTNVKFSCRVDSPQEPRVKWLKDWQTLADSTRIKTEFIKPDTYVMEITNAVPTDAGVYACQIENKAAKVTLTSKLTIEEDVPEIAEVTLRAGAIQDYYHVLEEIGRGQHGVVRRVVDMTTGRSYAANFMYMRNRAQKNFFLSEFEALRFVNQIDGVLRLHDAFETERSLIFVTEILTGPELLQQMVTDGNWTEAKVAGVVRQLLTIMKEVQSYGILHLDIKPSNLRLSGPDNADVKLINFALARFLHPEEDVTHNYGSVGFASPEQINSDVLTIKTDMWAIGVLTYVLLSGVLPFQGENDATVLKATVEGTWSFGEKDFDNISKEGKDFISKLIIKNKKERMSIDESLKHPWLSTESSTKINMDRIKNYYNTDKLKRDASKLYTTSHLQSLMKIMHGTAALYQPAIDVDTGEIIFPDNDDYGDYLDEASWLEWQLQFQDDPDSQEFQLRDRKFTVRESKHAAADAAPEKKDDAKEQECDSLVFVNKIENTSFEIGENAVFMCSVASKNDTPVVTWYRDETLLTDQYRAESTFNSETGIAMLTVVAAKDYDAGVYKCVARNKDGRVSCQARLAVGERPGNPGRPVVTQISGDEAFLTWKGPISDGNSYILGYRVDYRKVDEEAWTRGPCVTEEYALISGLAPSTGYIFRMSCHNKYGSSPYSVASLESNTLDADAPKVAIGSDLQPLLQFTTFTKQQLILPAESRRTSLTEAEEPQIKEANPEDDFVLGDVLSKGSYGEYKLCSNKATNKQHVMKIVPYSEETRDKTTAEFELLKRCRQAHIISVSDSYISGDSFYLVLENLTGMNILQYLCLKKFYKEDLVASVVNQVLDALQYLHHLDIAHCNLQPSSIVMATLRRPHVKLRDFTMSQKILTSQQRWLSMVGYPDFVAPEVIRSDPAGFCPDMWALGVLTFILLSGVSPFGGDSLLDTLSNVVFDRYALSDLYDNVTKDGVKFVAKLLKRLPKNRATISQCLSSRWLQQSESMVKVKNSAWFSTDRLRQFSTLYLQRRADPDYMNLAGVNIADLPKPTKGPALQPILSDRVLNRNVVNIRITESKSASPDIQVKRVKKKPVAMIEEKSVEVKENIDEKEAAFEPAEETIRKEEVLDNLETAPVLDVPGEPVDEALEAVEEKQIESKPSEPDVKESEIELEKDERTQEAPRSETEENAADEQCQQLEDAAETSTVSSINEKPEIVVKRDETDSAEKENIDEKAEDDDEFEDAIESSVTEGKETNKALLELAKQTVDNVIKEAFEQIKAETEIDQDDELNEEFEDAVEHSIPEAVSEKQETGEVCENQDIHTVKESEGAISDAREGAVPTAEILDVNSDVIPLADQMVPVDVVEDKIEEAIELPVLTETSDTKENVISKEGLVTDIKDEKLDEKCDDVMQSKVDETDKAILELSKQTVENVIKEAFEQIKADNEQLKATKEIRETESVTEEVKDADNAQVESLVEDNISVNKENRNEVDQTEIEDKVETKETSRTTLEEEPSAEGQETQITDESMKSDSISEKEDHVKSNERSATDDAEKDSVQSKDKQPVDESVKPETVHKTEMAKEKPQANIVEQDLDEDIPSSNESIKADKIQALEEPIELENIVQSQGETNVEIKESETTDESIEKETVKDVEEAIDSKGVSQTETETSESQATDVECESEKQGAVRNIEETNKSEEISQTEMEQKESVESQETQIKDKLVKQDTVQDQEKTVESKEISQIETEKNESIENQEPQIDDEPEKTDKVQEVEETVESKETLQTHSANTDFVDNKDTHTADELVKLGTEQIQEEIIDSKETSKSDIETQEIKINEEEVKSDTLEGEEKKTELKQNSIEMEEKKSAKDDFSGVSDDLLKQERVNSLEDGADSEEISQTECIIDRADSDKVLEKSTESKQISNTEIKNEESVESKVTQAFEEPVKLDTAPSDDITLSENKSADKTPSDKEVQETVTEKVISDSEEDETIWDENGSSDSDQPEEIITKVEKVDALSSETNQNADQMDAQDTAVTEECIETLESKPAESAPEQVSRTTEQTHEIIEKLAEETLEQVKAEAMKDLAEVIEKDNSELVPVEEDLISSKNEDVSEASREAGPEPMADEKNIEKSETINDETKEEQQTEKNANNDVKECKSESVSSENETKTAVVKSISDSSLDSSEPKSDTEKADAMNDMSDTPQTTEALDTTKEEDYAFQDNEVNVKKESEPSVENESIIETACNTEASKTESEESQKETKADEEEPDEEEVARLMAERAILEDAQLFC